MSFNIKNIITQVRVKTGNTKTPNEIFYLSLSQKPILKEVTVFNQIPIGTTNTMQSSTSPMYSDISLRGYLGKSSSVVTLFDNNFKRPLNLLASTVSTVYRHPKGNINVMHAPLLQKFTNYYGLPNNGIEIAPIVSGTGAFLNKHGFVAIATGTTTTKLILVYIV